MARVTFPDPPVLPYTPFAAPSPMRGTYRSLVSVYRTTMTLVSGAAVMAWGVIPDVLDPFVGKPGQMMCRIDLGFIRRGQDQPMPITAGRAPDRVGVLYCDLSPDPQGRPFLKSGDRVLAIAGPVFGEFEIRTIPDVAQDWIGAHHIEVQVIEVAKSLGIASPTPFPGSEGPDT